jgi:hypothetical protein
VAGGRRTVWRGRDRGEMMDYYGWACAIFALIDIRYGKDMSRNGWTDD